MISLGQRAQDLLFQIHLKQERIDALESGEEFVRMQERHRQELAYQDRIIKALQRENAEKDRRNTENRKHWEEVYDDIIAENEKKLTEKDKTIAALASEILSLKEELAAEKAKFTEAKIIRPDGSYKQLRRRISNASCSFPLPLISLRPCAV